MLQPLVRELEVAHGPTRELKKTEVVMPVLEMPTTDAVKQMIGTGQIAVSVDGVPVQNGLTTLNQVRSSFKSIYRNVSKKEKSSCIGEGENLRTGLY